MLVESRLVSGESGNLACALLPIKPEKWNVMCIAAAQVLKEPTTNPHRPYISASRPCSCRQYDSSVPEDYI